MKKLISLFSAAMIIVLSLSINSYANEEKLFYMVLGDSIAYGEGLKNPQEACYGKYVADTNGYDYKNYAVSGQKSSELLAMISEESLVSDLKKADIICISIGGNDFLKNNPSDLIFDAVLENDYSGFDKVAVDFYANLCGIVDSIKNVNKNAVILIQNLYNPQNGELKDIIQNGVDRLNDALYRYEENNPDKIVVVDVQSALKGDSDNFAKDGIHPSAKGNEIIAKVILEKLYSLGLGVSTQPVVHVKGKNISGSLSLFFAVKILTVAVKIISFLYQIADSL